MERPEKRKTPLPKGSDSEHEKGFTSGSGKKPTGKDQGKMKRCVVCVKPVPDPRHWNQVRMDPETKTLKREGIPMMINPLDKHALEAALSIRERAGGEVVLLSMAPPFTASTLREGLAMGADRALLLSDPSFAGSDTLATARILEAGCRWMGDFDFIFLGNLSVDGSTGQVCSQLAELLGIPSVMHVTELQWLDGEEVLITRKIEYGYTRLRGKPPMAVSVRKEINKPRYTSFAGIIAAESKEIRLLSNEELRIDSSLIGLQGSPTKMAGMELRRFERAREKLEGSPEEIVRKLLDKIYLYGVM